MRDTKTDEFRKHAKYCQIVARMMGTPSAKKAFEKQAEKWLKLADRVEKNRNVTQPDTTRGVLIRM